MNRKLIQATVITCGGLFNGRIVYQQKLWYMIMSRIGTHLDGGIAMKQMGIGNWILEVDVEKTREFYQRYHQITEGCDCLFCTNFVAACRTIT